MLGCTYHLTKEGRIPSGLHSTYVQYKQDTRTVVAWLVSHGTSDYKCRTTLSISDLVGLAEIIQKKAVEMPDTIDFLFREAIKARTQLSNFFRRTSSKGKDDEETLNHEHFTSSLTKIHADLCECCAKPKEKCKQADQYHPYGDSKKAPSNPFSLLKFGCTVDHEHPSGIRTHDSQYNNSASDREGKTATSGPRVPRLIDDTLVEAIELRKAAQEMVDLLSATRNAWEQASMGKFSIVIAAFMTNAAFAAFEPVEQQLKLSCDVSDPGILRSKLTQIEPCSGELPAGSQTQSSIPAVQLAEALQHSWRLLLGLKAHDTVKQPVQTAIPFQPSSQITIRQGIRSASKNKESLNMILQNIRQHIQNDSFCPNIVRVGSPAYAEVGYFLTHHGANSNSLRCCYGLQILLETYTSYLLGSKPAPESSGCRLQALRFTQGAIRSIGAILDSPTMPCRCRGTLAYHLENLHLDFETFLRAKVFDLYFQSPWVSGSHILEMLDALFYYGLRVFSYRNYLGSVLHVYNVLRQFTGVESIPLLENLCTLFEDILFPGGRPSRNFKVCYVRYMGGRLRFKSHKTDHKSGYHSMVIPAHTAKATAGFGSRNDVDDPRFQYGKLSLLHHVKGKSYHLDRVTWERVYNVKNDHANESQPSQKSTERCPCSQHTHTVHDLYSGTSQQSLQSLQTAILTEFTGPFPIPKINFFEVYLSCLNIISIISDKYHGDKARPGQHCLCFVDPMLSFADRCEGNGRASLLLGCRELVDICRQAMVEVLGGKDLQGFLWEGI